MRLILCCIVLVCSITLTFTVLSLRAQDELHYLPFIASQSTPISTTLPSDVQPTLPLRAAFYYPWFPEAWAQSGIDPFTVYLPALDFYDSGDLSVVVQHIEAMQYGQIEAGIVSWWGRDHRTDKRMPLLLQAAAETPFRWAIYYEPEAQGDPSIADLTIDLRYIEEHYGRDPAYLRIDGRMVVFVYADTTETKDSCPMVDRWKQANTINAYVVLKVFRDFRTCPTQPDGWHQYGPGVATSHQKGFSFSISPGFWRADAEQPRLVRNLARWRTSIREMIASNEPFQLITTFNEWGEGTSVEAAQEWQSASTFGDYLDALHNNGLEASTPTPTQGAGTLPPPATPTPTPLTTMQVITPVADSYVNQDKPTSNYGGAIVLRTDITPTTHSYLRFSIPNLPGEVISASLQIYNNNGSNFGYEVRQVSDNQWLENTLTYSTAPALGFVVDSSGPVTKGSWAEFDVSTLITQSGDLNLALLNLKDSAGSFASREVITSAPRLLINSYQGAAPPLPIPDGVLLATGDIADCDSQGDDATAALLDHLPGIILTLGDTVYQSGTAQEFADCFDPVWGRHAARIRPVPGNHDYLTPAAAAYYEYFGVVAGDKEKGYYSYDVGSWHIVALNSNCSEIGGCNAGSPQEQWLRTDLATHPAACTLAYMHHPRWSSGKYQENVRMAPLFEALYDHGVELLLAGHAHSYERYSPQTPSGALDLAHGVRQIVVGTGGKNHQPVDINVLPNSEVRDGVSFGVLQLTLYPNEYRWQFIPVPGASFIDKGIGRCH